MRNPTAGLGRSDDFNFAGRGSRVQQGVEYFSAPNINPGLQGLTSETPPDAGFRQVPPEQGFRSDPREAASEDAIGMSRAVGERDAVLAGMARMGLNMMSPASMLGVTNPIAAQAVSSATDASINSALNPFGARLGADYGASDAAGAYSAARSMGAKPQDAADMGYSLNALAGLSADPYSAAAAANDNFLAEIRALAEQDATAATAAATAQSAAANSGRGGRGGGYTGDVGGMTTIGAGPDGEGGMSLGSGYSIGGVRIGGPTTPGLSGVTGGANNGGGRTGGSIGGHQRGSGSMGGYGGGGGAGGPSSQGGFADGGMIEAGRPAGMNTSQPPGTPMLAMGFADGGQMGGMGAPGGLGGQMDPAQMETQVNQLLRDPNVRNQIIARAQTLMQTGELTPQEVQTMAQIAQAAMYNPALYPQLRAFALQQGMSALPPAYDPTAIMKIMAVARALGAGGAPGAQPMQSMPGETPPGQVPPTDQAMMTPPAGMRDGGMLHGPGTGRSDSIGTVNESTGAPVKVANGEYVIPAHVVKAKGREFFDNLLRRYSELPKEEA